MRRGVLERPYLRMPLQARVHLSAQDAAPFAVHHVELVVSRRDRFRDRSFQAVDRFVSKQAVQVDFRVWSARDYSPPWYLNESFMRAR
jgi:hypothetical protein